MKPRITILRRTELVEQHGNMREERTRPMRMDRTGHYWCWTRQERDAIERMR